MAEVVCRARFTVRSSTQRPQDPSPTMANSFIGRPAARPGLIPLRGPSCEPSPNDTTTSCLGRSPFRIPVLPRYVVAAPLDNHPYPNGRTVATLFRGWEQGLRGCVQATAVNDEGTTTDDPGIRHAAIGPAGSPPPRLRIDPVDRHRGLGPALRTRRRHPGAPPGRGARGRPDRHRRL